MNGSFLWLKFSFFFFKICSIFFDCDINLIFDYCTLGQEVDSTSSKNRSGKKFRIMKFSQFLRYKIKFSNDIGRNFFRILFFQILKICSDLWNNKWS